MVNHHADAGRVELILGPVLDKISPVLDRAGIGRRGAGVSVQVLAEVRKGGEQGRRVRAADGGRMRWVINRPWWIGLSKQASSEKYTELKEGGWGAAVGTKRLRGGGGR